MNRGPKTIKGALKPQVRRSTDQSKYHYGLVLGLAGVLGLMSLFLPTGRAGPEGISTPTVPVATVGPSRSGEGFPTLPEPKQATPAEVGQAIRQRSKSLEVKLSWSDSHYEGDRWRENAAVLSTKSE